MTDIEKLVERMESAAKAASPGKWLIDPNGYSVSIDTDPSIDENWPVCTTRKGMGEPEERKADTTHITEAQPQNVLTLIAEWRGQRAEIEKLRSRVSEMQHYAERAIENPDQPEGRERAFRTIVELARKTLETD